MANGTITGKVTVADGTALEAAKVVAKTAGAADVESQPTGADGVYSLSLAPGVYSVSVVPPDAKLSYLAARNVVVRDSAITDGIDFSLDVVQDFLDRLDDARFSIESQISEAEAKQAIALFSVANMLLAGRSTYRDNGSERMDILGVRALLFGLGREPLRSRFHFTNRDFLAPVEADLTELDSELVNLESHTRHVLEEAKRQFNLGGVNTVLANTGFPPLFRRYVAIGRDPLLAMDINGEDQPGRFTDKTKIAQADDLLRDLKNVVLQVVRSLSKYGSGTTRQSNQQLADFESRALEMLALVAQNRQEDDEDLRNQWAVLADLTGKNRDVEVVPYVVLARHGGKLLRFALDIYRESQNALDDFTPAHLRALFQNGNDQSKWWTTKIRNEAAMVDRYPLVQWG